MTLRKKVLSAGVVGALALVFIAPPAYAAGPGAVSVSVSGSNGAGTSIVPGTACVDGGSGDSWNYSYSGIAPAGQFTQTLPANVSLTIDLHAEPTATEPSRTYSKAFFGPNGFITLANSRGTLKLPISAGSCGNPTLNFNGQALSSAGTIAGNSVVGTGAYRQATGSGTFVLNAFVAAGSTNPFSLNLQGVFDVLDPTLTITNASGAYVAPNDFINRKLTVTYTVRNNGVGDAFGVSLLGVTPTTGGVTTTFAGPKLLGDIKAGNSKTVNVVYKLAKANPPCTAIYTLCSVSAHLTFHLADALDLATSPDPVLSATVTPIP